jgi:hypothetical protein
MSASISDKLDRVSDSTTARPVLAQLVTPGKAIGATSITVNSLSNWTTTTKVHFAIYNLTSAGVKDPTTQTDWTGIVSGNTITNLTLTGGTDQTYNPGAIVDPTPTAAWAKDLYDNISSFANQNGTLQTAAVQAALNIGNTPAAGWTPIGTTFTYTGNNGNREFTLTAPIDLTTTLQKGMRMQFTRGTAPPTQCMSFASASSQYATKSSPSGITFTTAFTLDSWVYLNSYANAGIIGRAIPGTSGFLMYLTLGGQVVCYTVPSQQTSYQSVPLRRWTHIAVTYSSGTMVVYIDGTIAPSFLAGSGSSFTQGSGPLQIGAYNSTNFFDGYISEARIWSVAQSQAQIQANMGMVVASNSTNLVFQATGNGTFNDSTTNANNLTATNGASATQTFASINGGTANEPNWAPMNSTEFVIVTDVSTFSGGVTTLKVFSGTCCVIPNMALSNPQYSNARAPFGFPAGTDKWIVDIQWQIRQTATTASSATWVNPGSFQLSVPTGEWDLGGSVTLICTTGSATGFVGVVGALSTSSSALTDLRLVGQTITVQASGTETEGVYLQQVPVSLSSQTPYYLIMNAPTIAGTTTLYAGAQSSGGLGMERIYAKCAYI